MITFINNTSGGNAAEALNINSNQQPNSNSRKTNANASDTMTKFTPQLHPLPPTAMGIRVDSLPLREEVANGPEGYAARNRNTMIGSHLLNMKIQGNCIELFRPGALVITRKGPFIQQMQMNPAILLYGDPNYPVSVKDGLRAVSLMLDGVSTMIKDPFRNVYGLFPGLGLEEPRAAEMRYFKIGFNLHDTQLSCFHGIRKAPYELVMDEFNADTDSGQSNISRMRPLVRFSVGTYNWEWKGGPEFASRFFDRRSINLTRHFHTVISQVEGFYLPITQETYGESEIVKIGRIIAHASKLSPEHELTFKALTEAVQKSKERIELKSAIRAETAKLKPVQMSELFTPAAYAAHVAGKIGDSDHPIHPVIADWYDVPY